MTADAHAASEGASPFANPGSQAALRQANQQRLVQTLRANGPMTQADLSRSTGLSRATISNLVKIMLESSVVTTAPTTSSGRRATSVSLNTEGAFAVGIDVGRSHIRVVLASLDYQVLAEKAVRLAPGHGATEGVATAVDLVAKQLRESGLKRENAIGAGVGIPGPIDRRTGTVVQGAILPEWVGIDILQLFHRKLEIPVFIDNDSNLGALAQVSWGPHNTAEDLVFVKVGTGIGSGLVLDGKLYYGAVGITGEIGHATISEYGAMCRCGNRGCLETVASTAVMIDLLSGHDAHRITVDELIKRARAGDAATVRVLDDAGAAVGKAMANVANLLNPQLIVVGGPLAVLKDLFLDPIRRGFTRHAVPTVGESTQLQVSALGDRAEALGAAALVFSRRGLADTRS